MKKIISVLLTLSVLLTWTTLPISPARAEHISDSKELKEIYSQILCIGCGGRKTIDHSDDCPVAKNLRAKVRALVEKGFDRETIISNFNRNNIAFIYQLPAAVIRNLDCPGACGEKVWVCLASENDCPVIPLVTQDIRSLKEQGKSDQEIVGLLESSQYQAKYDLILETAIKMTRRIRSYDISDIPDFVLDNAICGCACTESLRTCIEKMPWCKRISSMLSLARIYLYVMKLTPEDTVMAMYAPCGKVCVKKTEGEYLGNCYACSRPILDKVYYYEINGKKEAFGCQACYVMGAPLPEAILNSVECKVCPCGKLLSECNEKACSFLPAEKRLIKVWLLGGMTQDEVIEKLK